MKHEQRKNKKFRKIYETLSLRDDTKEYILVIEGTAPAIVIQRCDSPNLSLPALADGQVVE